MLIDFSCVVCRLSCHFAAPRQKSQACAALCEGSTYFGTENGDEVMRLNTEKYIIVSICCWTVGRKPTPVPKTSGVLPAKPLLLLV